MKSFKQFIVEYMTEPLSAFRNYINMSDEEKATDIRSVVYSNLLDDYFEQLEPEYDEDSDEIEREVPDIEDLDDEQANGYGEWLMDNLDLVADTMGAAEMPSWYYMSDASIIKNSWLCHVSNNVSDIIYGGFKYGMDDMAQLGLTTYTSSQFKKHEASDTFYGFSYTPDDFGRFWDGEKYGKEFVMFVSSGVRVFHFSDEEYQTVFIAKESRDFIPVYNRDGDYVIEDKRSGRTVFQNDNPKKVVKWVIDNFPQYRSTIVQRATNIN